MPANNILALDIGTVRIGVARANLIARIPEALTTIANDENTLSALQEIIAEYEIDTLVVGLPRNMEGLETKQTKYVQEFCEKTLIQLNIPIVFQDETLTSVAAEAELEKPGKITPKANVDARAAEIILDDYLGGQI